MFEELGNMGPWDLFIHKSLKDFYDPSLTIIFLFQATGNCYDHVQENCTMTGQIVQEIVNVIDATICQENLNLFGSIFGAQVFIL